MFSAARVVLSVGFVGAGLMLGAAMPNVATAQTCDPSYPDFCIQPPYEVGDLDCGDIGVNNFTVYPPDPHYFDGDYDGIGCESY